MFDHEAMREAGLNGWEIRVTAVERKRAVTKDIEALIDDCVEGRYDTDILKVNAKAILMRMVDDVFDCGLELGFTYFVPEYLAYLKMKQDEEF